MARIDAFLKLGLAQGCSDVHLAVGVPPMLRLHGDLMPIKFRDLRDTELEGYVLEILTPTQTERFNAGEDVDFSYVSVDGGRFRVNVFRKDTGVGAVFRSIPSAIPSIDKLGLPPVVKKLCDYHQGMILVTGCSMVPSIYIMVSGLFARMDPSMEEAAHAAGSGFLATIRRVTLPLLRPGLLAASIYFLVVGFETFEVPALLGMTQGIFVFTTMIYQATHPITGLPDFGLASGYAMIQLALSGVLIYLYSRSIRDASRFGVIRGKAAATPRKK